MAKLGYKFSADFLDSEKAEAFLTIADEIEKAEQDEMKKRQRKRGK